MRHPLSRSFSLRPPAAILATLVALSGLAAGAAAQEEPASSDAITPGTWEGRFTLAGYSAYDSLSDDGTFGVGATEVSGETRMPVSLKVAADGSVAGSMDVTLRYVDESAGADALGNPYHVVHDTRQVGQLALSGDVTRIAASGTLTESSMTRVETGIVEDMTQTRDRPVEWVFQELVLTCETAFATLDSTRGISLVASAGLPPEYTTGPTQHYNQLVALLEIWPVGEADSELITDLEQALNERVDELRSSQSPPADEFAGLVGAWHELQEQVASLNECDPPPGYFETTLDRAWLVILLRRTLTDAIEHPAWVNYDAQEMVALWELARAEDALGVDLRDVFYEAFAETLDKAIADGDAGTIAVIEEFAAKSFWSELQAQAEAAL